MLLIFIILVLLFSIPAFQTYLGKEATTWLNNEYKTNINIGKVGLQFNGDVELKEILIIDYKKDTLINAAELNTSILNFRNLYNGKLNFGDIDLEGLVFNIKKYKGEEDTNLDVFVAKFDSDNPRKSKSEFLLSSSDVSIENGTFRLIDENRETPKTLEFTNLNINATDFVINGPDVKARINNLAFNDSRGLKVTKMKTNFGYTLKYMTFDNLQIKTANSTLNGYLKFEYEREDLQDFTDKVKVIANFKDSDIALNEINTFYNEFGTSQRAKFSANLTGTLNNLMVDNLRLNTSNRTKIYGDLRFENLFNAEKNNFLMDGKFANLTSSYRDLRSLLPNILGESIPSSFEKLGNFTLTGTSQITSRTIKTNTTIKTDLGVIVSDLEMKRIDDIDNADYKGNIVFTDFDIGTFLNDKNVGKVSFNLDVDGKGFVLDRMKTKALGDIFALEFNGYTYRNIEVSGNFENKKFNGKFLSNDKNLKLEFNGLVDISKEVYNYDFVADVSYANLNALKFVTRDSLSVFEGIVDTKMIGTNLNDAHGSITFKNTSYKNQNDEYFFKDFAVTSRFEGDLRFLEVNSPDIIEGKLSGKFLFEDIGKLIENSVGSIYTNYIPNEIITDQYIDFNFKIYNKIVEVFVPDIELGKNTFIKGRVESDEKGFNLTFKSPQIKLFDYFADNIQLTINNKNPLYNTYVEIDSINTKFYDVSKFSLINVTLKDTLFIRSEFNGGKRNDDVYNLSLYYTINEENKSVIGFKKSDVTFKNSTWFVNENKDKHNKIVFERDFKYFEFDKLFMNHENEEIKLSGLINGANQKDIKLNFKDVDLQKITPEIDSLKLEGIVNGKLDILQQNGSYLPNSTVVIDNFKVNDNYLGSFDANIVGNQSLTNYKVNATIKDDLAQSFRAVGTIDVAKKTSKIDLNLTFKEFDLRPLNPLGEGVIDNIHGFVTGTAKVTGNLDKPSIDGELKLNQSGIMIPYLNVDYSFKDNASVSLRNQSFIFNNVELTDTKYYSKANLKGDISHTNFSDWKLNLDLNTPRFLVLNTTAETEDVYYGTGFIGGTASIFGRTNELVIKVDGQTKKGTEFKIPMTDSESYGDNSYIHFLTREEKESKISGEEVVFNEIKGLELDFDLDITQDAEVEIIIDPNTGHSIKGTGEGSLLFEINTNGKFRMWGDYSTFDGTYNFVYGALVRKSFKVEPGGTLAWEGDPLKAEMNINAVYIAQANPSPLLDNPINKSIPVNLIINLTGQLELPDVDFQYQFPTVSSTVNSELQYRLNSKEDRENQALYLLSTGSFSRGITDFNINGTIAERLTGIVNNLLTNSDNKLNIGLNYELGQNSPDYETDDRFGVTLQTQISDRVLINGKVGVPIGSAAQTVIAGDVQVDFLLNEEGTLTAKVFNRENSIRNFGEEIGYTQGVGISYNVDFDKFGELVDLIFKGKPKVETKKETEPEAEEIKESALPDFVGFKEKDDK